MAVALLISCVVNLALFYGLVGAIRDIKHAEDDAAAWEKTCRGILRAHGEMKTQIGRLIK